MEITLKKWGVYVVCGEASAVLLVLGNNIAAARAAALKRCEEDRQNIAWEGGELGETVWVEQVVYQGREAESRAKQEHPATAADKGE